MVDTFNEEHLQLSENDSQIDSIETLPAAVTTDIEGGIPRGVQAAPCVRLEGKQSEETNQSSTILKTVVVEQSYEVRKQFT